MKKILWLPGWYPNRNDPFDGDFIKRHALAASGFCRIHLIYVVKKTDGNSNTETTVERSGNLTEEIIYYSSFRTGIKPLNRFVSHWKYILLYRRAVKKYIRSEGRPDHVHVHVAMKVGSVAQWIKRRYAIPFSITEHWTGYLAEADDRLEMLPLMQVRQLKRSFQEASNVTVVSDHLGKAIQKHFPLVKYRVISNVVDDAVFYPASNRTLDCLRLIHASNTSGQKNLDAILEALVILKDSNITFQLDCYGTVRLELLEKAMNLGLKNQVFFRDEVPQDILANAMRYSHALILYSRFETFGCVIIEANACGIPVILSDIPVFHELVEEGRNGVFVKGDDPVALADALIAFESNKGQFDGTEIARTAKELYNYQRIGEQLVSIYT